VTILLGGKLFSVLIRCKVQKSVGYLSVANALFWLVTNRQTTKTGEILVYKKKFYFPFTKTSISIIWNRCIHCAVYTPHVPWLRIRQAKRVDALLD
jgi:hypothetical protein